MGQRDLIDGYLAELDGALTVPRRLRRRILAETADHLACAAAAREAAGDDPARGQREAIVRFGSSEVVARRFADELAAGSARRATWAGAVAVASFCALFAAGTQIPTIRDASPFAAGPSDAIGWLAVQIALACAALSAVRAWRHRDDRAVPAGKLRFIHRGVAVALAAVGVSVAADLLAAVQVQPVTETPWTTALIAGCAAVALVTLAAAVALVRAQARTRELASIADEPAAPEQDALDDLLTVAAPLLERAGRLPLAGGVAARAERLARSTAARALCVQLGLRTHPWRCALALAGAAGAGVAAVHLVAEGAADVPTVLLVSAVLIAVEGLAIVACFALLAGFLGIRRHPPAGSPAA